MNSFMEVIRALMPYFVELVLSENIKYIDYQERYNQETDRLRMTLWNNSMTIARRPFIDSEAQLSIFMAARDQPAWMIPPAKHSEYSPNSISLEYNVGDDKFTMPEFPYTEEMHFQKSLIEDIHSYEDMEFIVSNIKVLSHGMRGDCMFMFRVLVDYYPLVEQDVHEIMYELIPTLQLFSRR